MAGITSVVSLVVTCLVADGASAQANGVQPRGAGEINGVISDTSLKPLADATVTVVGTEIRVVTGANGRFRLIAVPTGQYVLVVRRLGFEAATARISVANLDTVRVSFALESVVATLDTVTVAARNMSPRLSDFYERRKTGRGQFLTQDEIEERNVVAVSDLLRRFLGLGITRDGGAAYSLRSACPALTVIVDGVARYQKLMDLPSPKEIVAIEFYAGPSEVPLQFKSTTVASCGLILVWTRDGSSAAGRP